LVLGGEARTDLEERLTIALAQLVEDHAPSGVGESPEDVTHRSG
jgi:hypothetical protein